MTTTSVSGRPEWFALYVKTGKENDVASILVEKGFEAYLPLQRHGAQGKQRSRKQAAALFPSYCFCRLDVNDRSSMVVTTPHVYGFVSSAKRRIVVPDADVDGIRRVENTQVPVDVLQTTAIAAGEQVARVSGGPFAGLSGRLIQQRGRTRFALEIAAVQQCLVVEVESRWLELN